MSDILNIAYHHANGGNGIASAADAGATVPSSSSTSSSLSSPSNASSIATPKSPPPIAGPPAAAAAAPSVSRADLIALIGKLKKRALAAEAEVGVLKKAQSDNEQQTQHNIIPLIHVPSPSSSATNAAAAIAALTIAELQSRIADQSTAHATRIASLQSELDGQRSSSSSTIVDLRTQITQIELNARVQAQDAATASANAASSAAAAASSAASIAASTAASSLTAAVAHALSTPSSSEVDAKRKNALMLEEMKRLQAIIKQQSVVVAQPVVVAPIVAPAVVAASFLLENANKELRLALAGSQSATGASDKLLSTASARIVTLEQSLSDLSKTHAAQLDAASKRLAESESKLAATNAKLVHAFSLVTESKKVDLARADELKATANASVQQQAAWTSAMAESRAEVARLQSDNAKHKSAAARQANALETATGDLTSEVRELKRHIASLQDSAMSGAHEMQHAATIHARAIATVEEELSRATKEAEQSAEAERRTNVDARVERQSMQLTLDNERRMFASDKEEAADALRTVQSSLDASSALLASRSSTLTSLESSLASERASSNSRVTDAVSSTQKALATSLDKYARLLAELASFKFHTIHAAGEATRERDALIDANAKLRDEIDHGNPEARKLFQLAEQQARRDDSLRSSDRESSMQASTLLDLRNSLEQLRTERDFLITENVKWKGSLARSSVDVDYLKSVMVQFLGYEHSPVHRRALAPVISQLLSFSPSDVQAIADAQRVGAEKAHAESVGGMMTQGGAAAAAGIWGRIANMTGMAPAASSSSSAILSSSSSSSSSRRHVTLPPHIPIGVNTSEHPSPFAPSPSKPRMSDETKR